VVQVAPINLTLKPPGTKRFKRRYDDPLSKFVFKFNLRRYNLGEMQRHHRESEASDAAWHMERRESEASDAAWHVGRRESSTGTAWQILTATSSTLDSYSFLLSVPSDWSGMACHDLASNFCRALSAGVMRNGKETPIPGAHPRGDGRGLHSSTIQLNLSRFRHKITH